jgi:exo-beta-1,3-glucanase (GH17 family)
VRVAAVLLLTSLAAAGPAAAVTVEALLGGGRLVAYSPTGYDPATTVRLSPRALRADADGLHRGGFRAITTYGASRALAPVCRFFKRRGFATVLVGIWDPRDRAEVRRAIRLRRCADGYVVGNEGLTFGRYDRAALDAAITRVRQATGRPVTTRETLAAYERDPSLAHIGDWLFPTLHPWYADHRESQDACGWTAIAYHELRKRTPPDLPVVLAETGLPTDGVLGASEFYQRAFFLCIEARHVAFAYFEAFDQPWKHEDAVAPHWGLFRADGSPKLWAAQQLRPTITVSRTPAGLQGTVTDAPRRAVRVVAYVQGERWEALPPVDPDRRGGFTIPTTGVRPAVVVVASRSWTAPSPVERAPGIDRMQVFARAEVPAM